MLFTLRTLGRLEEATIDLGKDLIVLTGPNNSSKTYVAHAIYGFCGTALSSFYPDVADLLAGDEDRYDVDLVALLNEHLDALLERMCGTFAGTLPDIFAGGEIFTSRTKVGVEIRDHDREIVRDALVNLKYRYVALPNILVEKKQGSPVVSAARRAKLPGQREVPVVTGELFGQEAAVHVAISLAGAVFADISHPYILTSDRSAVQLFSRELSMKRSEPFETLLRASDEGAMALPGKKVDLGDILRRRSTRYPQAIRDELDIADDLAKLSEVRSEDFWRMADDLEAKILGGGVSIAEGGEFRFRPSESEAYLRLHLASSSVRALASLSFYLRHLAQKSHFLIIDEPELNLHPHNQRLVARLLARLSRSGIKVMISTHSDYVVRELNNLIMLSRDKDGKLREKHGYEEGEILDPERVGAYAFDGAHGRPIAIGPAGIKVEAFDKDIKDLNRSASDIYFTLDEPGDDEA